MTNEELKKEYPIQDDVWPSRRWNEEKTDYVDLSGHEERNQPTQEHKTVKERNHEHQDRLWAQIDFDEPHMGFSKQDKRKAEK